MGWGAQCLASIEALAARSCGRNKHQVLVAEARLDQIGMRWNLPVDERLDQKG